MREGRQLICLVVTKEEDGQEKNRIKQTAQEMTVFANFGPEEERLKRQRETMRTRENRHALNA